jgi:hypothetical protein
LPLTGKVDRLLQVAKLNCVGLGGHLVLTRFSLDTRNTPTTGALCVHKLIVLDRWHLVKAPASQVHLNNRGHRAGVGSVRYFTGASEPHLQALFELEKGLFASLTIRSRTNICDANSDPGYGLIVTTRYDGSVIDG